MIKAARFGKEQREFFEKLLQAKRAQFLALENEHKNEAIQSGQDFSPHILPTDLSVETSTRELDLYLVERELKEISEIDDAMIRLRDGSFGVCQGCEEEISEKRLAVIPEARYCVVCEEVIEERKKSQTKTDYELDFGKPIVQNPRF